jgi:pimeloyl-ACP methyl ester carboxylesterase
MARRVASTTMRSQTIDIAGPVHVAEFGGSGDPMVLVHGLGGSHVNWLAVGPRLAEHFEVIAPDLAGFGLTPLAGRSSSVDANPQLLDKLLEQIGRPVVLVGNSMGGLISMMVAARSPQRVSALVLVDPALPTPLTARRNLVVLSAFAAYSLPGVGEAYVRRRAERLGPEGLVRETMKLCTVDMSRIPPDVLEAHFALARKRREFPWALEAYIDAARSIVRTLARRRRVETMMRSIAAPTLLLMGECDRLVPLSAARAAAQLCPSWRFEVYDDIGHTPQLEAPDRFVESVLRFSSTLSSSARSGAAPSTPA